MRRYWLEVEAKHLSIDHQFLLEGDAFHHIFAVCRQQIGSQFEVLIGDGQARLVEVQEVGKKKAIAKVLSTRAIPQLPKPHIHVAISIPKFQVFEDVLEKMVELGVHSVHPFFSDYSFVRKSSSVPAAKETRWQKIVVSATQQTGRGELMKVSQATELSELLLKFNQNHNQLGLFAYEGEAEVRIDEYLGSIQEKAKASSFNELWLFVGSEGGFSSTEVQSFQKMELRSVSLGEQVLRVETACIALLSVLKYVFKLY